MKFDELQKTGENQQLEFKEWFGKETSETVAAFSNASGGTIMIEKFGTGFFRIKSELQNSTEVSFKLESLNGFTRSCLEVISQDTPQVPQVIPQVPQDIPQDKIHNVYQLLTGMNDEMTRREIQMMLKTEDRKFLRKSYLKPALEKGFIVMTIPDKPNSRYQKYMLTDKGKRMREQLSEIKNDEKNIK